MCLGIPMKVTEVEGPAAWCEGRGQRLQVDVRLIPPPAVGDWVLVFHDVAREPLSEEPDLDRHFADLVNREPQLPEHLRKELNRG